MTVSAASPSSPLEAACVRLQPHITVHPLAYRHERWYVLRNSATSRSLRLNASAYHLVALMDGERTIAEIRALATPALADHTPTLDETAQLLYQLAAAHFILDGLPAELTSLLKSRATTSGRWWQHQALNPTTLRWPLWDPDAFLTRLRPLTRKLFSPLFLWCWLLAVVALVPVAVAHFDAISAALVPNFWTPAHAVALMLVYFVTKACHEMSHALAIKAWGGEVREVGVMLFWFLPCPYVDGSAASVFADKRKRALVAAAGVLAEITLAAIALLIWIAVEPGLLRTLALDVMLVGTLSTVLANGNPLLKFDGYYVLEDLIEIPNLASRAQRYYLYLIQRYGFGLRTAITPVTADGEARWFLFYAPAALIYQIILLLTIAMMFSQQYLAAGVAIATLTIATRLVVPVARGLHFVLRSPTLAACRARALSTSAGVGALGVALLGFVPLPAATTAEGVVWAPAQGALYSGAEGFVREILVAPHTPVSAGQALIRLEDPVLDTRIERLRARRRELDIERVAAMRTDRRRAAAQIDALQALDHELDVALQRAAALVIKSPLDGEFAPRPLNQLADRFVKQGELLGYVFAGSGLTVRAVVTQAAIGLIRQGVDQTRVRLAEQPSNELIAIAIRETPGGSTSLPSPALGAMGGGELAVAASDSSGLTSEERVFTIEITLPATTRTAGLGGRGYVRFDHGRQSFATQLSRSVRQLFLSHLGV